MKVLDRAVLHPFLFAAFPALFLLAHNIREVELGEVTEPLAFLMLAAALLTLIVWVLSRDLARAGIVVTVFILLMFSYGPIAAIHSTWLGENFIGETSLLLAWAILSIILLYRAAKVRERLAITRTLNVVGLFLTAFNISTIVFASSPPTVDPREIYEDNELGTLSEASPTGMPDIYYLIFDRYGGPESLRLLFRYDNSAFFGSLRQRGFLIADRSRSNYPISAYSMASSLNMGYLDDLARVGRTDSWGPLYALLKNSNVPQLLRSAGYRYVQVESGWDPTSDDPSADLRYAYGPLSSFSQQIYETSFVWGMAKRWTWLDSRRIQWERIRYQFDKIAEAGQSNPGPDFIFSHFVLPHDPFVFHSDGSFVERDELAEMSFREAFLNQVRYANRTIKELVDGLLASKRETDPIIVLQADEGPYPKGFHVPLQEEDWRDATYKEFAIKFGILNAVYVPDRDLPDWHRRSTPVNTFRMILNSFLSTRLPILPDRHFVYADLDDLYRFVDVTDRLRPTT